MVTVLVLLFATPEAVDLTQSLVSLVEHEDDCEDADCEGEDGQCPGTCAHCLCCVHFAVLALPDEVLLEQLVPLYGDVKFASLNSSPHPSGYRAPPFRPPTV